MWVLYLLYRDDVHIERTKMATNKKYKVTNSNTKKSAGASKKKTGKATEKQRQLPETTVQLKSFVPFILIIAAVLITLSFFIKDFGVVGNFIRDNLLFGIFSRAAYLLPILLVICAVVMFTEYELKAARARLICTAVIFVLLSAVLHVFFAAEGTVSVINPIVHYKNGVQGVGGGFLGGFVGALMVKCFSEIGAVIIALAAVLILVLVVVGKTPKEVVEDVSYQHSINREKRIAAKMEADKEAEYRAEQRRIEREERLREAEAARARLEAEITGVPFEEDEPEVPVKKKRSKGDNDIPPADVKRKLELDPDITAGDYEEEETQLQITDAPDLAAFDEAMAEAEAEEVSENEKVLEPEFVADEGGIEDDMVSVFEDPEDEEVIRKLSRYYLGEDGFGDEGLKISEKDIDTAESEAFGELEEAPSEEPAYKFPDIDLLIAPADGKKVDRSREIKEKEEQLIQTLERFNVHTKSAGAPSVGPTITRYELRPDPGTRVSSIVKLVDDIALSFATSGVRIEAPIPGKSAVGIEVPNSTREVVNLRALIDTDAFRNAESRLNVALGADVAGEPVYLDIPKMPHLLIAGATGMGKSVCINCLLISILYKASPDEVKLILIDPKKVEFSMYGDLPHLLVPVVSDPKKAAGALSWAVNEMERRFGLIDEEGVRNIFGYNRAVENDPHKEKLPEIVIIIDELADLMMTAADSVEDSICRLAQKARAAGMHLIIGTQRPSVDVITGTIKGNIPSRIACTVASQVDSRTIIDMGGAEKLIGKGDMLYSPVSATKPIRVQGAFVSDEEVERVVTFIKTENANKDAGYSSDVITQIETEAAKCTAKKKGQSAAAVEAVSGGEDEDPMFWKAVEIAIDSGKISTSLIQRKCSLGFGRAAKLIDRMENLGYVSAPDGQKPRQVLITREQYETIRMGVSDTGSAEDEDIPF
ncbi:MAG: DUF87 domain-containing protein [Ruminococcaceae bacterium]|nr:DUF87 domain-containing protein [Oscillospiraceae bacterium]